jgi:uncharacterized protein (TIGR02001 family)
MRQFIKSLSAALIIGGTIAGTAQAEGEFSGNVTLTSDYVFRGITQADGAPMIQGGFDYADDAGFYIGTWASGVDFGDGTSTEIDIYAGWTPSVGVFDLDLGAIYYMYPDAPDDPEQNFLELYAGAGTTVADTVDLGFSVAYSPDFYYEAGSAVYYSASVGTALGDMFGIDASLGYSTFLDDDDCADCDYGDYSVGLTTAFEGFDLDFRYIDTFDLDDNDEKFVVSVSRSL